MGFYYYAKQYCGCHVSWAGKQFTLPHTLPALDDPITVTTNDRYVLPPGKHNMPLCARTKPEPARCFQPRTGSDLVVVHYGMFTRLLCVYIYAFDGYTCIFVVLHSQVSGQISLKYWNKQNWHTLAHRGWVMHTGICIGNLTIIDSDNGLSPGWHQAIIWTNTPVVLIGPVGKTSSDILIKIHLFPVKKMHLKL